MLAVSRRYTHLVSVHRRVKKTGQMFRQGGGTEVKVRVWAKDKGEVMGKGQRWGNGQRTKVR